MKKKKNADRINRRKFVSHVATGTVMAFGMGVMTPRAGAIGIGPVTISGGVQTHSKDPSSPTESGTISVPISLS
jgi:hypothetical protein